MPALAAVATAALALCAAGAAQAGTTSMVTTDSSQYSLGQYGEIDRFGGFDTAAYSSGSYDGALTSGEFVDPVGFTVDPDDSNTLYVLDRVSDSTVSAGDGGATSEWRLQQLSETGTVEATSVVTLSAPAADADANDTYQLTGLAVDPDTGEVYSLVDEYNDVDSANVPYEVIAWSTGTANSSAAALDTPMGGLSSELAPTSASAAPVTFAPVTGSGYTGEAPSVVSYYDQITGGSLLGTSIYNPQGLAVDDQTGQDAVVIAAAGNTTNYRAGADNSSTVVQQIYTSGSSIGAVGSSWSSETDGFTNSATLASSDESMLGPAGISSTPAEDNVGSSTDGITILLDDGYDNSIGEGGTYASPNGVDVVDLSANLDTATIVASQDNAIADTVGTSYGAGAAINTDGSQPPYPVDGSGTGSATYNDAAGPQIVPLSNGLYAADFDGPGTIDNQSYNEAIYWTGVNGRSELANEGVRLLEPEDSSIGNLALTDQLSNTTNPLTSVYDTLGGETTDYATTIATGGTGTCSIDYAGASYAAGADGTLFVLTRGWDSLYYQRFSNAMQGDGGRQIIEFGPTTDGGPDTALTPATSSDPDAGDCPSASGTFDLYAQSTGSGSGQASATPLAVGEDTPVAFDASTIDYPGPDNSFADTLAATGGTTLTTPSTATPFAFEWDSDDTVDAGSGNPATAVDTFNINSSNGVPVWPEPTGYTFTYSTPNVYKPTLTLVGDYGTYAQQREVDVFSPPAAALKDTSVTATADQPVTFDGSESTVGSDGSASPSDAPSISTYNWTINGSSVSGTSTLPQTFTSTGTYTVQLTVTDSLGQTSSNTATETVKVVPAAAGAPTATLSASPASVTTGQTVSFTASATAGTGSSISSYGWSFGDGTSANTPTSTTTHTYSAAGTYTVKLTVTDADGQTATSSAVVTVTNPSSNPKPAPKPKLSPANVVLKAGVTSTTLTLQFKSVKVGTKLTVKLSEPKAKKAKTKSAKVGSSHLLKFGTGKLPAGATKIRFYETVGKGKHAKLKLVKTETVHVKAKKK
jgi:PKD repeat protein